MSAATAERIPPVVERMRRLFSGAARIETVAVAPGAGGVLVAVILGYRGATLDEILASVVKMTAASGMRPVFVTDTLDLRAFHRGRLAVEALPFPRGGMGGDARRWRLYRDEECRRIGRVWRPRLVLEFGRPLEPGQRKLIERHGGLLATGAAA